MSGEGLATEPTDSQVHRHRIIDEDTLEEVCLDLLSAIGEDLDRPELKGTPTRFARWWKEFIEYQDDNTDTVFETTQTDQMVVVSGIRIWSLCEHHLLPFFCDVSIGYITKGKVLGLSKFGRIAQLYAHRLQVQERLVEQIAKHVRKATETESVAVIASGEHLCMTMRGIKTPAKMISSSLHGNFRDEPETRAEFMRLVGYG